MFYRLPHKVVVWPSAFNQKCNRFFYIYVDHHKNNLQGPLVFILSSLGFQLHCFILSTRLKAKPVPQLSLQEIKWKRKTGNESHIWLSVGVVSLTKDIHLDCEKNHKVKGPSVAFSFHGVLHFDRMWGAYRRGSVTAEQCSSD